MNICFQVGDGVRELEEKCTEEAAKCGIQQLFGHPVSGGLRATLYNPMPVEAVHDLLRFLEQFERQYK